jgi:hypothetical protein
MRNALRRTAYADEFESTTDTTGTFDVQRCCEESKLSSGAFEFSRDQRRSKSVGPRQVVSGSFGSSSEAPAVQSQPGKARCLKVSMHVQRSSECGLC